MKVRIKHEIGVFEKGEVRIYSKEIYKIVAKKGKMNTLHKPVRDLPVKL